MTRPLLSRRRVLLTASCVVSLAGCSVLPDPPAAQIYRLSSLSDDPPNGPSLHKRLVIDVPSASESLDTDRIALTRNRTRFDYYADSIWTDRVPVLLQGRLIEAFENDGHIAEVGRDASALTPDYLLETEIRDFEARYGGPDGQPPAVAVALVLSLVRMPDRQMAGQTLITATASAARNDLDSIVEAFDVAVGKAMTGSVAWTLRTMGRPPDRA
jgi:cholesterol transport system auxiliary component